MHIVYYYYYYVPSCMVWMSYEHDLVYHVVVILIDVVSINAAAAIFCVSFLKNTKHTDTHNFFKHEK